MSTVTLSINGSPAPSSYTVGSAYSLSALVDGAVPLSVEWAYGLRAGPRLTGVGAILFSPLHAESHFLHVSAIQPNGMAAEAIFILSVGTTAASSSCVSVSWADPAPKAAGPNTATIVVSPPPLPPRSVAWAHYANGAAFGAGTGTVAHLGHLQPGVHRLYVTVVDSNGNTVVGESSIHVPSAFGLQSAVVPQQPINHSLVYLGAVYSPIIEGDAITATSLPFLLTTAESVVALIPGSTHFQVDLDPEEAAIDDEVVVRTQLGNWTLKGPPTGLTSELLPYDYQHGQPFQPAPLDLMARYALEAWNVHGLDVARFRFRVRFRCFAQGNPIYRYTPCEWSSYSGGSGERQRRLLALPTSVDISLDDETPQNRGGSRYVETFRAPDQSFILGTFETSGRPDRPAFVEDHFYTDQNVAAIYEKEEVPEVEAKATYGTPSVRPCVLDFSKFGQPRIVNKVKRMSGKLVLYLAGGAFSSGTVVTVRIYTGKTPGYVDVPVTIAQNVYNPNYDGFVRAGEATIDVSDYEFGRLGVVMDFTVDEASAGTATPSADPMASVGEDYYYARVNSPAIRVDTACFKDPVFQAEFTGTFLGSAVPLTSCNTLVCGPIGTYCYTHTSGTGTYQALQPYGFPAPFIAPYGNEASCYGNPVFMGEFKGTAPTTASALVTGYTGTTGCGVGYQYNPCSATVAHQLGVVFPLATTPHAALSFNGQCYTLIGQAQDLRLLLRTTAAETTPVTGCTDVACTGSNANGGSIDYIDQETLQQVTVSFPHLDRGVPSFGVAKEAASQGYGLTPPGEVNWALWHKPVFQLFTARESASVFFEVTPTSIQREIIVTRNGVRQHYRFQPGLPSGSINLQAGDAVTLEFLHDYTRYRGLSGQVKWYKPVAAMAVYDSVVFNMPSTYGTLTALGFCGLSNRQDYCFYGTLGTTVEMDLPNPDSVITVKDNSSLPEMILVKTRQVHEQDYEVALPAYQAQRLQTPLTLKFYAGRGRTGAHGELDVWCSTAGTFPQYLKVSPHKSLALADYAYRKNTVQTDTSRRSLRVASELEAASLSSPRVHVDDRGRRLAVVTDPLNDYVYENAQPYSFTGEFDFGISSLVHRDLAASGGPQLTQLHSALPKPRGAVYVDSQDQVWVTCRESDVVMVLSGDGNTIVSTFSVTGGPEGIAYCTDYDCVAIACVTSGVVKLYDAAARTLTATLALGPGAMYTTVETFASYNPISKNIYVAGGPIASGDSTLFEVNPRTLAVQSWPLGSGYVSISGLFYCQTTLETIVAMESGGGYAFNVSTLAFENLNLPSSTCRGACDVPDYGRVLFSTASNPPNGKLFTYDPRSRRYILESSYSNPVRATGWHPIRRKYYLSTLSIYSGAPGVGIVDRNGVRLTTLQNYDWGMQWVYSPVSKLMFNTIPATFYSNSYVGVYT